MAWPRPLRRTASTSLHLIYDDTRWFTSPIASKRRRCALHGFKVEELDELKANVELQEWLPICPHRLFKRESIKSIETSPEAAVVFSSSDGGEQCNFVTR